MKIKNGLVLSIQQPENKKGKILDTLLHIKITFRYTRENSWSLQAMNFKKLR